MRWNLISDLTLPRPPDRPLPNRRFTRCGPGQVVSPLIDGRRVSVFFWAGRAACPVFWRSRLRPTADADWLRARPYI